jgi:hypothetical protein
MRSKTSTEVCRSISRVPHPCPPMLRTGWESGIFNCSCRPAERALRAAALRCGVPSLKGLGFHHYAYPALSHWAKLFRPARRDWRSGQADAEQIGKLRADKIPTLAKRRLGWATRIIYGFAGAGFAIAAPASVYSLVHE